MGVFLNVPIIQVAGSYQNYKTPQFYPSLAADTFFGECDQRSRELVNRPSWLWFVSR